jgi:hypothetical protein
MITEETKRLFEKWEKTKLLQGLDEITAHKLVQLLENQRLYHEALPEGAMTSRMRRLAIPVLRRVVGALAKAGVEYEVEKEYRSFPNQLATDIQCFSFEADGRYSTLGANHYCVLDAEAELCVEMHEKLAERIRGHVASRKWMDPMIKPFVFLGIGQDRSTDSLIIFCRQK